MDMAFTREKIRLLDMYTELLRKGTSKGDLEVLEVTLRTLNLAYATVKSDAAEYHKIMGKSSMPM
ncbi:hypothetical protein TWF694_010332 [Orbilia ellipsospora]|uniref:Uncharacterized protein n=1 Tax=Orbilia ellipsospora TaxID=2528407 RepID=A0AAV9XCM6_9PEZI